MKKIVCVSVCLHRGQKTDFPAPDGKKVFSA